MDLIVVVLIGGALGWLSGELATNDIGRHMVQDVVSGVVGATAGSHLLTVFCDRLQGAAEVSVWAAPASFLGAVVALALLALVRHVTKREC